VYKSRETDLATQIPATSDHCEGRVHLHSLRGGVSSTLRGLRQLANAPRCNVLATRSQDTQTRPLEVGLWRERIHDRDEKHRLDTGPKI
jgi:hypothetical protein